MRGLPSRPESWVLALRITGCLCPKSCPCVPIRETLLDTSVALISSAVRADAHSVLKTFLPAICLLSTPLLLSLKLEEMVEAEDALSEANALSNTNAEVWGYLALICLQVSAQPATPAASLTEQGGLFYWHLFVSLKNML